MWQRRKIVASLLAMTIGQGIAVQTHAQMYPDRPVMLVTGSPPGGLWDVVTRLAAEQLQKKLGQPFIVITKAGAGGALAAQYVIQSPADGYTIFCFTSGTFPLADLQSPPPYTVDDLTPIAMIAAGSGAVLAVRKGLPFSDFQGFIAYAKANPNKLNYGSNGVGAPIHLSIVQLQDFANIEMTHIPYRGGGPAAQALLQGEIDVTLLDPVGFAQQIKEGLIIPVARAGEPPAKGSEHLPSLAAVFPGFDATAWFALAAPARTPAPVVEKLNKAMNEIISEGTITQQISAIGLTVKSMPQDTFQRYVIDDAQRWRDLIRKHKITAQ